MFTLCVMIMVFGVFVEFGIGWASIVGGLVGAVCFLKLPNVDEKERK